MIVYSTVNTLCMLQLSVMYEQILQFSVSMVLLSPSEYKCSIIILKLDVCSCVYTNMCNNKVQSGRKCIIVFLVTFATSKAKVANEKKAGSLI